MDIQITKIKIDYKHGGGVQEITPPFDLSIEYESLNSSPLLLDQWMSKGFDFDDLQIQETLRIRTPISLQFILR